MKIESKPFDAINPLHYRQHDVECITFARGLPYSLGCAFKYVWRYKDKSTSKENLEKALWYINDAMDYADSIASKDYLETLSLPDTLDDFQKRVLSDIIMLAWYTNPETRTEAYSIIRDEITRELKKYTR